MTTELRSTTGCRSSCRFSKNASTAAAGAQSKYYGNDRTVPSAFYTIGLTSKFDHPELFVSGLSRGLLDHVVEHFVNRISTGSRFGDGHKYSDLVGDTECCLRAVRPEHFQRYMPEALEILESASTALQCVCPDAKNKYAWDEGFAEDMRNRQPNLWQ